MDDPAPCPSSPSPSPSSSSPCLAAEGPADGAPVRRPGQAKGEEGLDDSRMLECEGKGCGMWVHAACEGISDSDYDTANATPNHSLLRYTTPAPFPSQP
jgi:hypothetical protein